MRLELWQMALGGERARADDAHPKRSRQRHREGALEADRLEDEPAIME
jgi:hypothetical protein